MMPMGIWVLLVSTLAYVGGVPELMPTVCGPSELLDDAAKAVREIGTAKAVWNGQPAIDFYRDSFGW